MGNNNDFPKSNIPNIEYYMDSHAKEIVDFIEQGIAKNSQKNFKIEGEITDMIMNELTNEMPFDQIRSVPFGPAFDAAHITLTDALVSSLWCGWLSQSMVNKKEPKFKEEYIEQFGKAIRQAYYFGRKYANAQKLENSS
jgi:hypothetical protein